MVTNGSEDMDEKIPVLREKFTELYAANINSNIYDERDLERIRMEDVYLLGYLKHQKGNVERAAAMMDTSLRFRKELELNDLTEASFPRMLHEIGAVYYHNEDKKGVKILYFQVKKNKKDPEKLTLVKKFIAWWIDKHYLKSPDQRIVVLFDMYDASFSNIDIELVKFQIFCFTTYYPALLEYMLIYEMPWVLNAIWKVIKTLLTAEQQNFIKFVKKTDIQSYIDPSNLFVHMGGMDTYEYSYIPSEDSGIESVNGEITPTEEHVQSVLTSDPLKGSPPGSTLKKRAKIINSKRNVTFAEKDQMMYTSVDGDDEEVSTQVSKAKNALSNGTSLNIAHRKRVKDDDSYIGPLLTISPAEELEFCTADDSKESMDVLSLQNSTDKCVAFKVKTTSPEKYRVRPSTGVVKPRQSADVSVFLYPGHQATVAKDKFLVMYMELEREAGVSHVNELFRNVSREMYIEHRLRCKIGQPKPLASEKSASAPDQLSQLSTKLEKLLDTNQRLERRIKMMFIVQLLLLLITAVLLTVVVLLYWFDVLPGNKFTVNSCMSYMP